jgi:hypothetical protein
MQQKKMTRRFRLVEQRGLNAFTEKSEQFHARHGLSLFSSDYTQAKPFCKCSRSKAHRFLPGKTGFFGRLYI